MRGKILDIGFGLFSVKTPWRIITLGILLIIGLTFPGPSAIYGQEKEIKEYPLPEHGILQLNVPKTWEDEVQESGPDRPLTIMFRSNQGKQFVLTIIPLWSVKEDIKLDNDEKLRTLMKEDWKLFAKKSKERQLTLHSLSGTEARGFYYISTDKASKKGEYKYMLRAGIAVGDLLLHVTFLSHQKDSPDMKDLFRVLEEAKHKSD